MDYADAQDRFKNAFYSPDYHRGYEERKSPQQRNGSQQSWTQRSYEGLMKSSRKPGSPLSEQTSPRKFSNRLLYVKEPIAPLPGDFNFHSSLTQASNGPRDLSADLYDAAKSESFYTIATSDSPTQPKTAVLNIYTLQHVELRYMRFDADIRVLYCFSDGAQPERSPGYDCSLCSCLGCIRWYESEWSR